MIGFHCSVRATGVERRLSPVHAPGDKADPESPQPHTKELPQGVGQNHQTIRHRSLSLTYHIVFCYRIKYFIVFNLSVSLFHLFLR